MDAEDNAVFITGVVTSVIYTNDEGDYSVIRLETPEKEQQTVVGCLPYVYPGEEVAVSGERVCHPVHGEQLKAVRVERRLPDSAEAIYRYLAAGAIKGIGPVTAMLIVSEFGDKTLEVIEHRPKELSKIRGISSGKAAAVSEEYKKQTSLRRLTEFFGARGLKPQYAVRLYKYYGENASEVLAENPYVIVYDRIGAAFSDADTLAFSMGFEYDDARRIEAALLFELNHNAGNGHSFIPRHKLAAATSEFAEIESESAEEGIDVLADAGEIIIDAIAGNEGCYLARLYEAELYTADRIKKMASETLNGSADITKAIDEIERELGVSCSPVQRKIPEIACKRLVMAVTGGPGTGKTTSVKAVLALFEKLGLKTVLAAPTGRAAKRMSELTGREAFTVHRLLEACPTGGEMHFRRNAENMLQCDAVVLDECSMVDIILMSALLSAIPEDCRLLLVGDADQLPSVGPGNVFSEIIRSGAVETVRLTEIFRQSAESRIVENAHMINKGACPDLSVNTGDFFFLKRREPQNAADTIVDLCVRRLPEKMGIDPSDIQVLAPGRKSETGTVSLNLRLREELNPPDAEKNEKKIGEITFREGDKVMQIKNNYDIMWQKSDGSEAGAGIFNGDIGLIISIDSSEERIAVDFDGKIAVYGFDMPWELEHAYAITVHKSQGSEFPAVILSVAGVAPRLCHRALLYTAVTRAKELLILVGSDESVDNMTSNYRQTKRYSGLKARLESS